MHFLHHFWGTIYKLLHSYISEISWFSEVRYWTVYKLESKHRSWHWQLAIKERHRYFRNERVRESESEWESESEREYRNFYYSIRDIIVRNKKKTEVWKNEKRSGTRRGRLENIKRIKDRQRCVKKQQTQIYKCIIVLHRATIFHFLLLRNIWVRHSLFSLTATCVEKSGEFNFQSVSQRCACAWS